MAEKKSWIMYKTWIPLFESLPTEQAGQLIKAICIYENGDEVTLSDPVIASVFEMIKKTLDTDAEEYEKVCQKRAESASKAKGSKCKQKKANASKCKQKDATEGDNDNENDNDNDNDLSPSEIKKNSARSRFTPPTVEEVKQYCQERGNNVDAESFVDYYSSQRWKKANGQPVADWKGCVRTWEKTDRQQVARSGTTVQSPKIHNFPERQYDYAALEARLTQNGGT